MFFKDHGKPSVLWNILLLVPGFLMASVSEVGFDRIALSELLSSHKGVGPLKQNRWSWCLSRVLNYYAEIVLIRCTDNTEMAIRHEMCKVSFLMQVVGQCKWEHASFKFTLAEILMKWEADPVVD